MRRKESHQTSYWYGGHSCGEEDHKYDSNAKAMPSQHIVSHHHRPAEKRYLMAFRWWANGGSFCILTGKVKESQDRRM